MNITIEHAQEAKEQDIFFPGNVVIASALDSTKNDLIVLVTSSFTDPNEGEFAGVALSHPADSCVNKYCGGWDKEQFKQFYGKIILENK